MAAEYWHRIDAGKRSAGRDAALRLEWTESGSDPAISAMHESLAFGM
jgi:hypothetical protein